VNAAGELEPGDFQPNDYSQDVKYTPTVDEEVDGDFTLAVVSNNTKTVCPQAQSTQTFQISPSPTAAFTLSPDKGCGPLGVTFTNQSDVNGEEDDIVLSVWDFGDGTKDTVNQKQVLHYYNYKGVGEGLNKFTVKLTVFSKAGCDATIIKPDTVEVFVTPIPKFRAKPTYTTVNTPKIEFINESDPTTVDENTIWEWNFGDPYLADGGTSKEKNTSHLYRDTGKYTVSLKATNPKTGCDSMVIKENYIDIRPEIIVFIPNAFTPGGIGRVVTGPAENNTFKAVVSSISSYNLKVYNRWGQLMFETEKPEEGWDGKFLGKDAQMDVYIYVLKVQSLTGKDYKYTGSVSLIR
jgi:gliding motility-associated-like protein